MYLVMYKQNLCIPLKFLAKELIDAGIISSATRNRVVLKVMRTLPKEAVFNHYDCELVQLDALIHAIYTGDLEFTVRRYSRIEHLQMVRWLKEQQKIHVGGLCQNTD